MSLLDDKIQNALLYTSETSDVEFKSSLNPSLAGEWVELTKDFVAMANSGGGVLFIGLDDDGNPSDFDSIAIMNLDPADVINKVFHYTGQQFDGFEISKTEKAGKLLLAITISAASMPLVFCKPGTYAVAGGKQKTAFSSGTVYFRHGAKSEPGNSDDLRLFLERRLEEIRKLWLDGITKVVEAPAGSRVEIVPPGSGTDTSSVRLVNDPSAPTFYRVPIEQTHPYRQKEVVQEVNKLSGGALTIKPYHIQCIRKAHKIDSEPRFCYKQKFASAQYSPEFVQWIIEQYTADPSFFEKAKLIADENKRGIQGPSVSS